MCCLLKCVVLYVVGFVWFVLLVCVVVLGLVIVNFVILVILLILVVVDVWCEFDIVWMWGIKYCDDFVCDVLCKGLLIVLGDFELLVE